MKLIERINADIITAYKARTEEGNETKALLGVLKGAATKVNKVPEDSEVIAAVKSMIKTHEKSMSENNVPTLTSTELAVLEAYLPKQLSEDELTSIVNEFISENEGANMGTVMGYLKNNYGGQYDGRMASTVAKNAVA